MAEPRHSTATAVAASAGPDSRQHKWTDEERGVLRTIMSQAPPSHPNSGSSGFWNTVEYRFNDSMAKLRPGSRLLVRRSARACQNQAQYLGIPYSATHSSGGPSNEYMTPDKSTDNSAPNNVSPFGEPNSVVRLRLQQNVAPPRSSESLKRKFHEVDFTSSILKFHVIDEASEPKKKVYHFSESTFNLAIPNFQKLYELRPSQDPFYMIENIAHAEFEKILHWVVFGQLKNMETEVRAERLYPSWEKIIALYFQAHRLEIAGLQNDLIDFAIETFLRYPKDVPWRSIHSLFSRLPTTRVGLGKLFCDIIIHRESDEKAAEVLRSWAEENGVGESVLPYQFFAEIAIGMINKRATPLYEEDPSQYHISESAAIQIVEDERN